MKLKSKFNLFLLFYGNTILKILKFLNIHIYRRTKYWFKNI